MVLAPNVQGSFKPRETAKTRLSCRASREGLRTGGRQAVGAAGNQLGSRGRAEARDYLWSRTYIVSTWNLEPI